MSRVPGLWPGLVLVGRAVRVGVGVVRPVWVLGCTVLAAVRGYPRSRSPSWLPLALPVVAGGEFGIVRGLGLYLVEYYDFGL